MIKRGGGGNKKGKNKQVSWELAWEKKMCEKKIMPRLVLRSDDIESTCEFKPL